MKKLLTILFAISALIFVACEDKDDKDATPKDKTPVVEVCDPACNADTETCVCKDTDTGDHICACEAKATDECKCDDGSACPEGGKDACQKHEDAKCDPVCSEGKECKCTEDKCDCADVTPAKCDPAGTPACATECKEDESCICQDDEWKCVPKNTAEECFCDEEKSVKCPEGGKEACEAKPAKMCEPACSEDKECACADDKCECVDKAKEEHVEECFCDDAKTVKCPEGGKDACAAEPTQPVPVE